MIQLYSDELSSHSYKVKPSVALAEDGKIDLTLYPRVIV